MNCVLYFNLLIYLLIDSITTLSFDLDSHYISYDLTLEQSSIYQNISFQTPTLNLCFGSPNKQCFNVGISTASVFILLDSYWNTDPYFSKQFFNNNSSSYSHSGTSIGTRFYHPNFIAGSVVQDYISLPNIELDLYKQTFILLSGSPDFRVSIEGLLGLRKYYSQESSFDGIRYSFLHFLHNTTQLIQRNNFALIYYSNNAKGGKLYFGEDYGNYPKCNSKNVYDEFPYWNCDLNSVHIGDEDINIEKSSIIFDSFQSIVIAPYDSGMRIINKVISLHGDKCINEYDSYYNYLICSVDLEFKKIPDIKFIMGEIELVLKWEYLFKTIKTEENKSSYISIFAVKRYEINDPDYNNKWIIGGPAFIDNLIIFDKSTGHVGIIHDYKTVNQSFLSIIHIMVILVSITGIGLTIITKVMIKPNKK